MRFRIMLLSVRGLVGVLMMMACVGVAQATDAPTPPERLFDCVACHGADGIGKSQQYPDLRGQKAYYLEKQLRAFRSGERHDATMNPLASALSDDEIAALAAYFAAMDRPGK